MKKSETDEDKTKLISSYNMLINKEQMGDRFKIMSFFPSVLREIYKEVPVAGFQ